MLRGAWILENIIGTPPAAPPPDVEGFKENKEGEKARSVREIMEQHRSKPSCNACHGVMDPLGFALENFDAIGEWRSKDRYAGTVIDASGKLVDGTPVNSPADLRQALMKRPEQFVQTMTEKLMTYALGRSVEYYDMPAVRAIVRDAARDNYRFSSIVMGIVRSAPFQMRKAPHEPTISARPQSRRVSCSAASAVAALADVEFELEAGASDVHHEEASLAPHVPPRRRRHRRPAAAGRDDPGLDRAGADRGQSRSRTWGSCICRTARSWISGRRRPKGTNFELTPILKPFAPFQKQLTIVSGLENKGAIAPPVHALSPGTWLSCVTPREGQEPHGGVTVDQIAAAHLGQDTPLPSLEVATEGRGGNGNACDRTYGCSYGNTISFRTPTTPLPMEADPRKLFERLFGQGDTPQERKAIAKQYLEHSRPGHRRGRRSPQDVSTPQDRARLGDYLESVREIERRVQKMEERDLTSLDLPDVPVGSTFDQRLTLMFDMIALAYQANLTRVFSFMMAGEGSNQTYNHIGVSDAFHPLSHHQNDKARKDKLVKIQTYHSQAFAKFLAKLAAMPDGDGSMLDHSILLYGSNMSNSNAHNHFPLPTLVVGGGCGKLKGDQHLKYPDQTQLSNLLLTLLERAGVPEEKVGQQHGRVLGGLTNFEVTKFREASEFGIRATFVSMRD